MSQQGQPVEAERPPNRLQVLDHQIGSEPQRVGHLGAAAPTLVEVEQCVASGQRVEIRPEPLQVEPGTAVKHHDCIGTYPLHPIEEPITALARDVTSTPTRLLPLTRGARLGARSRAGR